MGDRPEVVGFRTRTDTESARDALVGRIVAVAVLGEELQPEHRRLQVALSPVVTPEGGNHLTHPLPLARSEGSVRRGEGVTVVQGPGTPVPDAAGEDRRSGHLLVGANAVNVVLLIHVIVVPVHELNVLRDSARQLFGNGYVIVGVGRRESAKEHVAPN